jgi:hypothetical protein
MSPARCLGAALVTMIVAAACSEESATSVPLVHSEVPTDLVFTFPELSAETLIQGEVVEIAPPEFLAGVISDGEPTVPNEEAFSEILSASTNVGFTADYAYSNGRQTYTGNKGRVETRARVSFNGTQIGSQPAFAENYVPYLFDFGRIKQLLAEAYVFIDQDCGLKVDGDSSHFAGWQWFLGGTAPSWGPASMSTQAFPPQSQGACLEEDTWPDSGSSGGSDGGGAEGPGPVTCWYWVTYDPETGEIYDADFLYCDGLSEGG